MVDFEKIKPWIYKLNPEFAHTLTETVLKSYKYCPLFLEWLKKDTFITDLSLEQHLWGLKFPNPVGVAGGFDKNGTMVESFPLLGFGWGEVGAITPKPQFGNPKPRVWRFPEWEAVQNSFGFNNQGLERISNRLKKSYPFKVPIGANIGKNKTTPPHQAIIDYKILVKGLEEVVDFFVVNISSPNTPGLRTLLNPQFVEKLIGELSQLTSRPILLKLSPDMEFNTVEQVVAEAIRGGVKGIVLTNTTTDYSVMPTPIKRGGISGRPLQQKSFQMLKFVATFLKREELLKQIPLISVGGIDSPEEGYRRIIHGASLLQLYTPLIFKGPKIVAQINRGIIERLERDKFKTIGEAVGANL